MAIHPQIQGTAGCDPDNGIRAQARRQELEEGRPEMRALDARMSSRMELILSMLKGLKDPILPSESSIGAPSPAITTPSPASPPPSAIITASSPSASVVSPPPPEPPQPSVKSTTFPPSSITDLGTAIFTSSTPMPTPVSSPSSRSAAPLPEMILDAPLPALGCAPAVADQIHSVAIVVSTSPIRCSKKFPSSLSSPSMLSNRLSGKVPTNRIDPARDGDPRHLRPPDPPSPRPPRRQSWRPPWGHCRSPICTLRLQRPQHHHLHPLPLQIAEFLKIRTFIDRVNLFYCGPVFILEFTGTGISITITAPNSDIPIFPKPDGTWSWVRTNTLLFVPASNITRVFTSCLHSGLRHKSIIREIGFYFTHRRRLTYTGDDGKRALMGSAFVFPIPHFIPSLSSTPFLTVVKRHRAPNDVDGQVLLAMAEALGLLVPFDGGIGGLVNNYWVDEENRGAMEQDGVLPDEKIFDDVLGMLVGSGDTRPSVEGPDKIIRIVGSTYFPRTILASPQQRNSRRCLHPRPYYYGVGSTHSHTSSIRIGLVIG